MSFPTRLALLIVLAFSVTGVGAWTYAQTLPQSVTPVVLSGDDVGFRVVGHKKAPRLDNFGRSAPVDVVVGQLVVRVNGQWVEAEIGGSVRPATN